MAKVVLSGAVAYWPKIIYYAPASQAYNIKNMSFEGREFKSRNRTCLESCGEQHRGGGCGKADLSTLLWMAGWRAELVGACEPHSPEPWETTPQCPDNFFCHHFFFLLLGSTPRLSSYFPWGQFLHTLFRLKGPPEPSPSTQQMSLTV